MEGETEKPSTVVESTMDSTYHTKTTSPVPGIPDAPVPGIPDAATDSFAVEQLVLSSVKKKDLPTVEILPTSLPTAELMVTIESIETSTVELGSTNTQTTAELKDMSKDGVTDTAIVELTDTPADEFIDVNSTPVAGLVDRTVEEQIETSTVEVIHIDTPTTVEQKQTPNVEQKDTITVELMDTTDEATVEQIDKSTDAINTPSTIEQKHEHEPTAEHLGTTSSIEIVEIGHETTLFDTVETIVREEGQTVEDNTDLIPQESKTDVGDQEVADQETFIVIVGSSQRQQPKLVDSRGYSYTKHTNNKDGTITWRCSVRNTRMFCGTTVKQFGDKFVQGSRDHCHPGLPGEHISAQIRSQVKQKAQARVFQPARQIVDEVLICNVDNIPYASLPNPRNLTRLANRSRKRQKDEQSDTKRGRSNKRHGHKRHRNRSSSSSSSSSRSRGRSRHRKKHKRHRSYTSSSSSSFSSSSDSSESESSSSRERKRHKKKKRKASTSKRRHKKHKRKSSKRKSNSEKMSGLSQLSKYLKEHQTLKVAKKTKNAAKKKKKAEDSSQVKQEMRK